MVRLCARYDEAARSFDAQGSSETSRGLDVARTNLTDHVRSLMDQVGQAVVVGPSLVRAGAELAYFNTWFTLRGGWK